MHFQGCKKRIKSKTVPCPCYNTKLYMICVTECMQHGVSFLSFLFLKNKKEKTEQEKNSNTFTQQLTNQGQVLFFWLAKTYYACWLILKNGKGKLKKENSTQHVNYCTRERLEVLRQCKSIAPIQIMHSMGNGDGVCWCRAHGLKLLPGWQKLSVRVGANLQGSWNKQGTNCGHSCGEKVP